MKLFRRLFRRRRKPIKHNSSRALIDMYLEQHPGSTLDDIYALSGKASKDREPLFGTPIHPKEES